jgi:hypothetical protein
MKLRGMSSLPSITSCPKLENGDTMIIIGGSKYIWNSFNPNRALYYAFDNYKKYSVEQISENISLMARIAYISVRDNIEENMAKKYLINNTTITNSVFVTKITL